MNRHTLVPGPLFFIVLFLNFFSAAAGELVVYPTPKEVLYSHHNDDFTVRVRKPGGEWMDLYEYKVEVDMDNPAIASMVGFDFSEKVEVQVKKNNGDINSVKVRPLSYGISPVVKGNTITFSLTEPRYLSVEFNGDKLRNLHVFANGLETMKPLPSDPDVVWFGPGVHKPADGKGFRISSGKTVYLAAGAILRGKLIIDSVSNVRIIGRGMIEKADRGIEVTNSDNVLIDGITVVNPVHYSIYGGSSRNMTISNFKSFSSRGWSDGIDLMSCSDVNINRIFMRNSDDCIAIYTHRWDFYGSARNYIISNAVLWADIAHTTNIGLHGNTDAVGDTIENILFKDIDILEHDEDDTDYQGAMALSVGDLNLVRNIRYENVRVENFQEGQLFSLRLFFNEKYNTGPGRSIENILFKNISYTGDNNYTSVIDGLDKDHMVKDVTFENLTINGKKILNAKDGNIRIGKFTGNIRFKP